jgi:hypothetical protein
MDLTTDKARAENLFKKEEPTSAYDIMKAQSIPVREAVFHRVVKSWNGEPETAFYATGGKPSRTATMWLSPCGLICEQAKGRRVIIPLANVVYTIPL